MLGDRITKNTSHSATSTCHAQSTSRTMELCCSPQQGLHKNLNKNDQQCDGHFKEVQNCSLPSYYSTMPWTSLPHQQWLFQTQWTVLWWFISRIKNENKEQAVSDATLPSKNSTKLLLLFLEDLLCSVVVVLVLEIEKDNLVKKSRMTICNQHHPRSQDWYWYNIFAVIILSPKKKERQKTAT